MGRDRGHVVLSALVSALNHRLRTPLAVISNELEIVKARIDPEDYHTARKRLQEVIALLGQVSELSRPLDEARTFMAVELLQSAAKECKADLHVRQHPAVLRGDRAALERVFSELMLLCKEAFALETVALNAGVDSSETSTRLNLIFSVPAEQGDLSCYSFTEYFNEHKGLDSVTAPLLDSITSAHHGRVLVQAIPASKQVVFWLEFPSTANRS